MTARARHVCPICGNESPPRAENPSFPFCSPPCKLVDLGAWLDGSYRIPGPEVVVDGDDGEPRREEDT